MSYQSLLFCPDEKTARTVTQVLTELEFAVEPCSEPFAAVKKLMGEHFDAIVVDCDNEQNATLLFKSARNSASNQASLAVAVVEGQAGVAKAFRIGANLVLTKPINVEQAKGTLRVARGLLRKGEPAKAAAPIGTTSVPASLSRKTENATPAASVPAKPAAQAPNAGAAMPRPSAPWQVADPVHSASSPVASSVSAAHHHDELDIDGDVSAAAPVLNAGPVIPAESKPTVRNVSASPISKPVAPPVSSSYSPVETKPSPALNAGKILPTQAPAASHAGKAAFGTGAASAPAPARSGADPSVVEPTAFKGPSAAAEASFEKAPESGMNEASTSMTAAPSLSFGGIGAEPSSGGSKKALFAVAAAVVVAAGLYVGWTQFHASATSSPTDSRSTTAVSTATAQANNAQSVTSATVAPPSTKTSSPSPQTTLQPKAALKSAQPDTTAADKSDAFEATAEPEPKGSPKASNSSPANQPVTELKPGTAAIVIKKGAALPSQTNAADTPAPSVMVAATNTGGLLSNLIGDPGTSARPVLQTLNVSQGVSQGLLIKKIQPSYPSNALRMHVEGAVQLLATIGKSGNITAVKTLSGEPALARAAVDAVKQWKYKPYYLNGEPVEIQTQVTVNFKLPR
jgi:TonB family protein